MMPLSKISGSCKMIDISKLYVSPFNARVQENESTTSEAFTWLCNSIRSEGLLEPLVVRQVGNQYEIVAGTRRFAALKHIGAEQAQVVIKDMSDNDVRIASLIENIHRLNLDEDELEKQLREIYLTAWDEWKPTKFPITIGTKIDNKIIYKEYDEIDFENDEMKILLARTYVHRLHNETNKKNEGLSFSKTTTSKYTPSTAYADKIFPTEQFRILAARVGYSPSYQYNILRGFGAFSPNKNFYEELPPTWKEIADKAAKEAELKEAEKQQLARRLLTAYKTKRQASKAPKTKIDKAKKIAERFKKEKVRNELKKEQKKKQQKEPINPHRARGEILGLGHKLFKLLTGQEMHAIDPRTYESFAKNTQAIATMQQLTTYFAGSSDIAAQQQIIIPLYIAVGKYRDMLYEAAEAQRRKEEMSGQ